MLQSREGGFRRMGKYYHDVGLLIGKEKGAMRITIS
jgi:hypothetical protein